MVKEIGQALKEQRESIGVSVEEAAADLKLRVSQIEDLEAGNKEAFSDIFYLKYFIRDYAKYLGMNSENMIDEFNEYLFDCTSRISLEDIQKAKKKSEIENAKKENRVASPYTVQRKTKKDKKWIVLIILIIIVFTIFAYFITSSIKDNNKKDEPIENII